MTDDSLTMRQTQQGSDRRDHHSRDERGEVRKLAGKLTRTLIGDLLSVEELVEQIQKERQKNLREGDFTEVTLETLGRGLCSRVLWEACQSPDEDRQNVAFGCLRTHLEYSGLPASILQRTTSFEREEILQEAMIEILKSLRSERGRPEQPFAFLGWARIIFLRQATRSRRQKLRLDSCSLEELEPSVLGEFVVEQSLDPLAILIEQEIMERWQTRINNLRNENYRAVFLQMHFQEREAQEIAASLHATLSEIHLWHYRGRQALQKQLAQDHQPRKERKKKTRE